MALNKYKLGDLISLSDERNSDQKYKLSNVKGISIKKEFIETIDSTKKNIEKFCETP